MSIHLRVCPCDTERNFVFWERFKEELQTILSQKIIFKPFKDYAEEDRLFDRISPEIYFASPDIALELRNRDYLPVARFSKEWDRVILLTLKGNHLRKYKRLAVAKRRFFFLGILLSHLQPEEMELLYTNSNEETLQKLIKKEADIGLVYERFFEKLSSEEKDKFKILEIIPTLFYHYLMVKRDFYEKNKKRLRKIYKIEPFVRVSKREIEKLGKLYQKIDFLFKFHSNKNLLENIIEHPGIFIGVYRDKFIYANRSALEMAGYSLEEFLNLSPEEIVYEKDRARVKKIIKKRLKGERFPVIYRSLRLKTKDGRIVEMMLFSQTIIYEGRYAGLIIGVDISAEKQLERFLNILREANKLIIRIDNEKELFKKICKTLINSFELSLVSVLEIDLKKKTFKPFVLTSTKKDMPLRTAREHLIAFLLQDKEKTSVYSRIKKGKIIIKNDIKATGFSSLAVIPIFKKKKIYGVLTLCSEKPYYFDETIREILKELQRDLSFAIEKIELMKDYQLLYHVADQSKQWIVITDKNGKILYVSPFVCELSGYEKDEILGQNPRIFKSGFHSQEFYQTLWGTILSGRTFSTVIINRAKDGSIFKLEEAIHPVKLPDGEIRFIAIGKDVTKEEYLLEEIEHFKFYDPLTELYNFATFIFKVSEEIKKDKILSAMILLDVKNLAFINYQYGIKVGDQILKEVAKRLKDVLKERDIVARAGGDEIIIWVSKIPYVEVMNKILEKIEGSLEAPVETEKGKIKIRYNAGIVLYPRDGETFNELYERLTLTLSKAKEEDLKFRFFDPQVEKAFEEFQKKEILIKRALEKKLFVFYYQPIFEVSTLKVVGFEALARIREKEKIYMPSEFIDYLEGSPYLIDFESWGFRELLKMIKRFNLNFSINISAVSFFEEKIIEKCRRIPEEFLSKVCIEITERTFIKDLDKARKIIESLKSLGTPENKLKIAIDDFGTGYSSIIEIKELPVDFIKIDKRFIADMTKGKKEISLVKTIIDLAHNFDIKIIAEGVETKEQLEVLFSMGCDYVQGFYLSRPVPEELLDNLK